MKELAPFLPMDKNCILVEQKQKKGKKLGTQILMSKTSGGAWTVPQVVAIFKDSTINVSHPALSNDGEYLYFVSDVRGGYGGKDIWRTKKKMEHGHIPKI